MSGDPGSREGFSIAVPFITASSRVKMCLSEDGRLLQRRKKLVFIQIKSDRFFDSMFRSV
jgi:hypothetical protein